MALYKCVLIDWLLRFNYEPNILPQDHIADYRAKDETSVILQFLLRYSKNHWI